MDCFGKQKEQQSEGKLSGLMLWRAIFQIGLTTMLSVCLTTYVYLPFRHHAIIMDKQNHTENNQTSNVCASSASIVIGPTMLDAEGQWAGDFTFKAIFYFGLACGSLSGGVVAYFMTPKKAARIFAKIVILVSFLSALVININKIIYHMAWFWLAFSSLASYLTTYIYTMESIPGSWMVYVSVGLFGIQWSISSLYSIILVEVTSSWQVRLFWNGFALFCIITLQEIFSFPKSQGLKNGKKEILTQLANNKLGLRYVACLLFLWFVHGYVFYGIYHLVYNDSTMKHHIFKCAADFCFKIVTAYLCQRTRQKRTVLAVFVALNALACFALMVCHWITDGNEQYVETTLQICSFLIAGSWNILWVLTVETFGPGVR